MDQTQSADRDAALAGVRDAAGVPAAVLAAGMIGFGAFSLEYGFGIWLALACTAGIWALPGQVVLLEMLSSGAPGYLTLLVVALTGARFLPMTMALMPVIRRPGGSHWTVYVVAQLIAMTGWAWAMQRCPAMPQGERLPYFIGFAAACWAVSVVATAVGYWLAGWFPEPMRLGFVFLTPVYFFVILVGDVRTALAAWALACGAVAGPLFHLVSPQWSVLLSGLGGGTLAFLIQKRHGRA
jgi:predicted branched-subunit amino acid permease